MIDQVNKILYDIIKEVQTKKRGIFYQHTILYDFLDKNVYDYGHKSGKYATGHIMSFAVNKEDYRYDTKFFIKLTRDSDRIFSKSLGEIWDEVESDIKNSNRIENIEKLF